MRKITIELTRKVACPEEAAGHKQLMTFDLDKITPWALNAILHGDPKEEYSYAHDYDVRIAAISDFSSETCELYDAFLAVNTDDRFTCISRGADAVQIHMIDDSSCRMIISKTMHGFEAWDSRQDPSSDGKFCPSLEHIKIAMADFMNWPYLER